MGKSVKVADNVALGPLLLYDRAKLPEELSAVAESGARAPHERHLLFVEPVTGAAGPERRECHSAASPR